MLVVLSVGCLTSQQHASVSQGRICSDNCTCCHTEIEVADPTFYLSQSKYTDTGPTSPSADPITPGTRQGSHWSADGVTGMARPRKNPGASEIRTRDLGALEADALPTRPTKRLLGQSCLSLQTEYRTHTINKRKINNQMCRTFPKLGFMHYSI